MTRFIFKRIAAMVFVLFSISVLVFLIFFATPGVDPAARIAGRNADQLTLATRRIGFGSNLIRGDTIKRGDGA